MSESVKARRTRQGVSLATQQWLIDRAGAKRQRKAKRQSNDAVYSALGQRLSLARLSPAEYRITRREERARREARA